MPLFPLNVVLFPGEQLPLHIFEPRYRRMVRDCLDNKTPFGMLLALQDGVVRVGCTAEVLEVIKSYEDGRMDIVTVGRDPFRVLELFQDDPVLEGRIDILEDRESSADAKLQKQLTELFESCYTLLFNEVPPNLPNSPGGILSYSACASLPIDLLCKQQILELRSEVQRQERLLRYLEDWAPHLQQKKVLRQRAGSNGHGLN